MTSARQSATLYREGAELDDLLAELDEAHPGQVRVVDVTYGREGGVLGFFAKRRVGVRYALDGDAPREPLDDFEFEAELDAPASRSAANPLEDLLTAAEAAEAEAMVTSGVAPDTAPDQPNVEFARLLLDLAVNKANQRRATEDAARAAFVEPGTRVLPVTEPELPPVVAAAPVAPIAPPAPPVRVAPPVPAVPPVTAAPVAPAAPAAPAVHEVWTPPPAPAPRPAPAPAPRPAPAARRPVVAESAPPP